MVKNIPGQVLNDDQVIWRYMDFISFYSLLEKRCLFFRRLDKYSDAYEGTLPVETLAEIRQIRTQSGFETTEQIDQFLKGMSNSFASYRPHTLANSWTMDTDDNYAMWKIYLHGATEGVALKTTIGQLRQAMNSAPCDVYFGKVKYGAPTTDYISPFEVATWKKAAYKYEQEFRALVIDQFYEEWVDGSKVKVPTVEVGMDIQLDINNLFGQLYISPFAGPWFYDIVESVIHKFGPQGLQVTVMSSDIMDK